MRARRRKFIRVLSAGGAGLFVPSFLPSCDSEESACLPPAPTSTDPFDVWEPDASASDIRLTTLSYALLAPNPHNLQPWFVQLRNDREYDVFIDESRALPHTDPLFRQLHIGLGCFLELAEIAARSMGHAAQLEYFPEGEYANDELDNRPVARVTLPPDDRVEADPLFAAILERRSNEEVFDGLPLEPGTEDALRDELLRPGVSLRFGESAAFREEMTRFVVDAITVELGHPDRDLETISTWRFTDEELLEHRDGTDARDLGSMGITPELLLAPGSPFKALGIQIHDDRARSASGFGVLVTEGNSRTAQLDVGRVYVRLNLRATAMGVAMGPFSQVLQEYSDMLALQNEFVTYLELTPSQTAQMLFRVGHAAPSPLTPRRRAYDVAPC